MAPDSAPYDVLVLGRGLGASAAATACADAGLRVIHVQEREAPPARWDDLELPSGPRDLWGPGGPLAERLLGELLPDLPRPDAARDVVPFQIVLPEGRLDLTGNVPQDQEELERELPNAGETLAALDRLGRQVDELLPEVASLLEGTAPPEKRLRAENALGEAQRELHAFTRRDQRLGRLLCTAAAPLPQAEPGLLACARFWWRLRRHGANPPSELQPKLQERYAGAGGATQTLPEGWKVTTRWGKPTGLRAEGLDIRARVLISGLLLEDLIARLDSSRLAAKLGRAGPGVASHREVLHLRVAPVGIPVGLTGPLLLADLQGDHDRPPIWMDVVRDDRARGDPVRLTVQAARIGPEDGLYERCQFLLPFLEEHLLGRAGPFPVAAPRGPARPTDRPGFESLPLVPGPPNLLLASAEVLPGLGADGELIAGLAAARKTLDITRD